MRRNWTAQELVDAFQTARSSILKMAHDVTAAAEDIGQQAQKRKLDEMNMEEDGRANRQKRKTRSQSRRSSRPQQTNFEVVEGDTQEEAPPGLCSPSL